MRVPNFGMIVPILGMLPVLLGANPVSAQAFKCVEQGRTVYQATPCAGGKAVDTRGSSGVTGLREEADRLAEREAARHAKTVQEAPVKPKPRARVPSCIVVGKGPIVACAN